MGTNAPFPMVTCLRVSQKPAKFWCAQCDTWHVHGATVDVGIGNRVHRETEGHVDWSPFLEAGGHHLRLVTKNRGTTIKL